MPPKVLFYTIAIDRDQLQVYRQQARMLVASLKRCGFEGDMKILHNGTSPIFDYPQKNVEEIGIDTPLSLENCFKSKYVARHLLSTEGYDWVMFLDCDFIINSKIDDWFTGPEIIRYACEPNRCISLPQFNTYLSESEGRDLAAPGVNSGSFIIKGEYFNAVMEEWERIDEQIPYSRKWGDQPAWNRLLLDTTYQTKEISNPPITFYYDQPSFMEVMRAPAMHFCGCGNGEKVLAMQAKFITHFHTDDEGTLMRLLER
ncbi:hypothetical protein OJ996_18900 [Luteolibacter sp. GHJ8]|uniref:Nucleotide-diphospho-sugar transferase n=1 Tax=Luteolibacter rhizosphaerae TaxID=2989719 RepID=A0ABT3G7Q8_9BACT|nr:hypothetical protein [Luteolibacter rhizosphaerae]MCW1915662.1 hypothetical protein [Luteolibacter rhizosphaerae]